MDWLIALLAFSSLILQVFPLLSKGKFCNKPTTGIWLWVIALNVLILATVLEIVISSYHAYLLFSNLTQGAKLSGNVIGQVLLSALPWGLMGATGILIALISIKLEPKWYQARQVNENLSLIGSTKFQFKKIPVIELALEMPIAFAFINQGKPKIFVSALTLQMLNETEFQLLLEHEWNHVRLLHLPLIRAGKRLVDWFPWLYFAQQMNQELARLTELAADKNISDKNQLAAIRSKLITCQTS